MQNAQHRPQWLACSLQNCCHKKQNVIPGPEAAGIRQHSTGVFMGFPAFPGMTLLFVKILLYTFISNRKVYMV